MILNSIFYISWQGVVRSFLLVEGHSLVLNLSHFLLQGEEFTMVLQGKGEGPEEMVFERLRETVLLRMLLKNFIANHSTHSSFLKPRRGFQGC